MTRYCFNWAIAGSTIIEAATLADAQHVFDIMSEAELIEEGTVDFGLDEVLTESEPGCFDQPAE